jgi:hypothetical protein
MILELVNCSKLPPVDDGERTLRQTIKHYLPKFRKQVLRAKRNRGNGCIGIVIPQAIFASGFHTDEYTLLGAAIKYAGLHDVPITIIPYRQP